MIRVGIIGLGYWGPNLLRNFSTLDDCRVAMCCDTNPARLKTIARNVNDLRTTTSADDVIDNSGIDLVVIATPPHTHFELARRSLEAGKHVFVEKPLTTRVDQAEELTVLSERLGRVLMVDHTFIYHPAIEKIRDILRRGELGEPCYYDSTRINLGLFQQDTSVLWDLAPHDVSIMEHLIARPIQWVQCTGARHAGAAVESMAYVTIQFADNILGHLHVNWLSPVKTRQIILGGTRRMLVYDDNLVTEKVKVYDRGIEVRSVTGVHQAMLQYRTGDMVAPAISNDEALRRAVQHLLYSIREGQQPLTDGNAGLRVVQILCAAEKSLRSGHRAFIESEALA